MVEVAGVAFHVLKGGRLGSRYLCGIFVFGRQGFRPIRAEEAQPLGTEINRLAYFKSIRCQLEAVPFGKPQRSDA